MENMILGIISSIATGSTVGTIAKGVLLLLCGIGYFYVKYLIKKKMQADASLQSEKEKQAQEAALPVVSQSVSNEAHTGEDKLNNFFGDHGAK